MNLTTSGKLSPNLSYRLNVGEKAIKATITIKLGDIAVPIPVTVSNPFYQGKQRK